MPRSRPHIPDPAALYYWLDSHRYQLGDEVCGLAFGSSVESVEDTVMQWLYSLIMDVPDTEQGVVVELVRPQLWSDGSAS